MVMSRQSKHSVPSEIRLGMGSKVRMYYRDCDFSVDLESMSKEEAVRAVADAFDALEVLRKTRPS